jgi:hypothetical protein
VSLLTRRSLLGGAAGACALGLIGAKPAVAGPASGPLRVLAATPNTRLTGLLNAYSDSSTGWTGADSTYSARLADGRQVWVFSDTFLGPVNPDGSRPRSTPFLNNSYVVATGDRLTTVHGGTTADPTSLYTPADPTHWYWMGAALPAGGLLQQILVEFGRTGTGPWDFAWMGTSVARVAAGRLGGNPIDIRPLPSGAGITWASWLQPVGGYLYIYGVEDLGASKYLHVARVRGLDLSGTWRYWAGSEWSTVEGDSVRVTGGVGNEYSVTPWAGRYLLVTQDTTELFSTKIVGYVADTPTGPFTGKTLLYTTPETGALGSYGNPNVYTYNPHVHPEYSDRERLVVSYNVNSLNGDDLYADVSIYRPRFIDVRLADAGRTG